MKFEELFERRQAGQLSQEDAARVPGVSVRTFRRWEGRYGADGDDGLLDRRLDRVAGNRVPAAPDRVQYPASQQAGKAEPPVQTLVPVFNPGRNSCPGVLCVIGPAEDTQNRTLPIVIDTQSRGKRSARC